jgi:hypothetical protein
MSTLTWSNVTGDQTNAGSDSLKNAGSLFSKAFENFSGAVEGRQKRETKDNTESLLNQIRGISTMADFDAQAGNFSDLEALKEQAGGNLDTTAISKALSNKVPELHAEETRVRNETIGQLSNQVLDANAPGSEGALEYKAQISSLRQMARDAGASSSQTEQLVKDHKAVLADRESLSPQGKAAVDQNNKKLGILSNAAQEQAKAQLDSTLANNPGSHTLNAEGNAISVGNVYDKIRQEYPQGSFWGGIGGDELQELVGKYELNGITKNGSIGLKVGDQFKEGTVKVEPWMYTMAMDIAGQSKEDSFGSPTLTDNLFKETLAQIAFNPKYKVMAANAAKAKRDYSRRSTELQLSRLKESANFTKNIKSSENNRLLEQLQREAK